MARKYTKKGTNKSQGKRLKVQEVTNIVEEKDVNEDIVERSNYREQVESLSDELTKSMNEVSELKSKESGYKFEIDTLKNNVVNLGNHVEKLKNDIDKLNNENQQLKQSNEQLKNQVDQISNVQVSGKLIDLRDVRISPNLLYKIVDQLNGLVPPEIDTIIRKLSEGQSKVVICKLREGKSLVYALAFARLCGTGVRL